MFTVSSVSHYMTSYNGQLGHYQLNFVSYVDRPEFLNHNFFYFSYGKVLFMRFSIWKPEYLTMVVHRAFEFRSQIQISLIECNMIGYSLTWQVM